MFPEKHFGAGAVSGSYGIDDGVVLAVGAQQQDVGAGLAFAVEHDGFRRDKRCAVDPLDQRLKQGRAAALDDQVMEAAVDRAVAVLVTGLKAAGGEQGGIISRRRLSSGLSAMSRCRRCVQRAWREDVALIDQSFHMTDLYVRGPDTVRLLSDLAINSFAGFGRNKAKQLVCCSPDGFVIGDMIVFGLEDDEANVVGRPVVANWVRYQAETGGYDVTTEFDQRSVNNPQASSARTSRPASWPRLRWAARAGRKTSPTSLRSWRRTTPDG